MNKNKNLIKSSLLSSVFIPFTALFLSFVTGAFFLAIAGVNPIDAYISMITGSLGSLYGITETIVKATPLLFVSTGICIAYRTGIINIGGEGQMIIGALTGTIVALILPWLPFYVLLPLVLCSGFFGGGLYGAIPGILKARLNVNEILATVMLNTIALQILYLLLRGPMIDPQEIAYGTGYPQSAPVGHGAWLSRLLVGTRLHSGVFIALLFAVTAYFFLWRTGIGYRMRAVGKNTVASEYGGINVSRYIIFAMFLSGGLAGLAGMVEVAGIHHRLLDGISAGYGFTGIVTALFGKLHPLGCIPASFFFGALLVGADMLQRTSEVPGSMVYVVQGFVVIFMVGSEIFSKKFGIKK